LNRRIVKKAQINHVFNVTLNSKYEIEQQSYTVAVTETPQ